MSTSINTSFSTQKLNAPANTFGGDKPKIKIPVTLIFSASEVGASDNPRKRPATVKLTENQIEAKIFEHFGLDVKKDAAAIKERLGSGENPFALLDTTGTFKATYNLKTGKYEIIDNIEAGLYKRLEGKAAQIKTEIETQKSAPDSNNTAAGKRMVDGAGYLKNNLANQYDQSRTPENSVSAVSESNREVKAITDTIESITGTENEFDSSQVGKQMNRLGVSSLRLAGSINEVSADVQEKIHDTVREYLPEAVNDLLDGNRRQNREIANSLKEAGTSVTREDDFMDGKVKADGKPIPVTEDLANKVMYFPEAIPNAIDSAIRGEFKDDDGSYSDTFGKIAGGLIPAADVRDIVADGKRVIEGENGAYIKLGASIVGAIPIAGDIAKPIIKKLGKEILEKSAKEIEKEVVEKLVKEGIEKEVAEKVAKEEVPKLIKIEKELIDNREQFRQTFGEIRYNEYAKEIETAKMNRIELKDIPTEDLVAIKGYTSADYQKLNDALRSKDTAKLKAVDPYIKVAESGLSQLPSFEGVVYRGVDLNDLPEVLSKYKVGQTITEDAFTSSSLTKRASFKRDTLMIIESKTGKDVSVLSDYPKQKEILFKSNTKFEVERISVDESTGKRIIRLKEVL